MSLGKKRKPPKLKKRKVKIKPSYLIVIATEGQETEPQYFSFIKEWCRTKIKVEILPAIDGESSPAHVFKRLDNRFKDLRRELDLGKGDQFWLVFDFDTWPPAIFDDVRRSAGHKGFRLAVSNPCFELWLYLHHESVEQWVVFTKSELVNKLQEKQGSYNPSNLKPDHYCGKIDTAVMNAEQLNQVENEEWPLSTGTHVYKLVNEIRKLTDNPNYPFRRNTI